MWAQILKTAAPYIMQAAGSLAAGKQRGRESQNAAASQAADFSQNESQSAEIAAQNRAGLDLRQREFSQESQSDAYRKALMSSLAMNMRDSTANRPAGIPNISFSGGMRPSAIGAEGKAAASLLNRQAMEKLMSGEKFDKMPGIERTKAPIAKQPGFWENALGTAGLVGSTISGAQATNQQNSVQDRMLKALEELNKPQGGGVPNVMTPQAATLFGGAQRNPYGQLFQE